MKAVGIATDSHSGITQEEAKVMGIMVLPMPLFIEEQCFYEDISVTREEFFNYLNAGQKVSTSQPSLEAVRVIQQKCSQKRLSLQTEYL